MARVNLAAGKKIEAVIQDYSSDGFFRYGYVEHEGRRIPVAQSTFITHPDGTVEKEWDEIVEGWGPQLAPADQGLGDA